jgi:hypothetical protein
LNALAADRASSGERCDHRMTKVTSSLRSWPWPSLKVRFLTLIYLQMRIQGAIV